MSTLLQKELFALKTQKDKHGHNTEQSMTLSHISIVINKKRTVAFPTIKPLISGRFLSQVNSI